MSDTQEASATKESSYSYDLDNKLIAATIDGTKTTIDYLPDGLRSQKTTGTATTQYGYNGSGQVVSEKASNGNSSTYIRGDRVLVKKDQTASKDYYLFNGHGDVVQMVDTSGAIVNSYGYDEWGNIAKQQETVANSFKYAGEAYDSETGLYYLKARYYDPSQGRFLNEDSYEGQITNPHSINGYTYVHNNPLIYVDPTGHVTESYNDGALRNLLQDARSKVNSKSDALYSKYKAKVTEVYGNFVDDNTYNYLFDLTTKTSTYGNSTGKSDWAIEQLVSGYQEYELAEYIATMAMGGVGGVGPGGGKGRTYSANGNAELRALRRPAFDEWVENGFTVGDNKFQLNQHAYNSLFKSGRKDIMPDDIVGALENQSMPAAPGSVLYTNPHTGTKVYVNPESKSVVGIQPKKFQD
ncbi:RHS repeat-associated core domain-containing protein [Paenibacillus kyungheensis]